MSELPLPATALTSSPARAAVPADAVRAFYDQHVVDKVADFVDGNRRVDAAWDTIQQWAPPAPRAILEVGCGFGQITWRLATRWPDAQVTGFDISPRSIELAGKVFQRDNLMFAAGQLEAVSHPSGYDLIVLVDVYEHIAVVDRPAFQASLNRLLAPAGRLVLTFPTPAHQRLLRANYPDRLQPVDVDIEMAALQELAIATEARLVMFSERDVWTSGDYAHAALGRDATGRPVERVIRPAPRPIDRAWRKLRTLWRRGESGSREARLRLIERSLGRGIYRPR